MNATLLESPVQTVPTSQCEAELSALVKRPWYEVRQVRREPAELRQEASDWKVVAPKSSGNYKKL